MKKDKIMVFIPVYNCEKQITRVLSQINDDVLTYVDEIIVVNNLSTDNTVKVTQDYLLKHRELPCKIINNNAKLFNLSYNLFVMALRYRLNKKKYIDSYCKKDIYKGKIIFDNTVGGER